MASADEYAAWIVKNSDKRGTPEFSTVAKAYELAKSDQSTQEISKNITPEVPSTSVGDYIQGAGEAALSLGTGLTTGTLGMIGGTLKGLSEQILSGKFGTPEAQKLVEHEAMKGMEALTFSPRSRTGQQITQGIGEVLQQTIPIAPLVGEIGALTAATKAAAPITRAAAGVATDVVSAPVKAAAGKVAEKAKSIIPGSTQPVANRANTNLGAAATPLELQRATEAEMAGLRLSEGEVKRSPELLAWEKEKAKTPEYQAPFLERQQENNRAAINKLNQVLDDTGAEAVDYSDTGVAVVDTLLKGLNAEKAKTNALYTSFRNSPEAQSVVNTNQITSFLNEQPKNVSGITGVTDTARQNAVALKIAQIDDAGNLIPNPNATLGQLEDFRQSVSAISAANPNDKRLASIIKRQIDEIGDPVGGELTRAMRAQRRSQAQKYENRVIVSQLLLEKKGMSDAVTPIEDVFKKTILNARPSEITHLKRVLSTIKDNEGAQAWKELQGATVKHLIEQSEGVIGADNLPTISGAKLNKAIKSLDKNGKLDLVMGKEAAEQIRNLNQVLQYIQSTPPLTSINNSGTARTVMALMGESALNGSLFGVPLPVVQGIKMLRSEIKDRKIKDQINKALNFQVKQGE